MKLQFGNRGSNPEQPHLFPSVMIGDYELSVQADRAGYQCSPRERFDDIREYEEVEVTVWVKGERLNPTKCQGFRKDIAPIFDEDGIAHNISHEGVAWIAGHLKELSDAGITLSNTHAPAKPVMLTDDQLEKLLEAIDGATFAGQWPSDEAVADSVANLLKEANDRGIDIYQFGEILHLYADRDEAPSP